MAKENVASEKHVKRMGAKEERLRHRQMDDIKVVMASVHGRRLMWRLLEKCGAFKSVHHPSGSQVYYNAGQQDVGHFVMSEILEVDPQLFLQMQVEAKDYDNV